MSDFRVGSAPGRSFIHVFPDAASRERETEVVSGFVNRKCVKEAGSKSKKDRQWLTLWCILRGSSLEFYRVEGVRAKGQGEPPPKDVYPPPNLMKYKVGFIQIEGAIVELDYTSQIHKEIQKRRRHLFRILLQNRTEYLLQASSDNQRTNWVLALQNAAKRFDGDDSHLDMLIRQELRIKTARCSIKQRSRQNVYSIKNHTYSAIGALFDEPDGPDSQYEQIMTDPQLQLLKKRLQDKRALLRQFDRMYHSFFGNVAMMYSETLPSKPDHSPRAPPPRPLGSTHHRHSIPGHTLNTSPRQSAGPEEPAGGGRVGARPSSTGDVTVPIIQRLNSTGDVISETPGVEAHLLHDYYLVPGANWSLLHKGEPVQVLSRLPCGWFRCLALRDGSCYLASLTPSSHSVTSGLSEMSSDSGMTVSDAYSVLSEESMDIPSPSIPLEPRLLGRATHLPSPSLPLEPRILGGDIQLLDGSMSPEELEEHQQGATNRVPQITLHSSTPPHYHQQRRGSLTMDRSPTETEEVLYDFQDYRLPKKTTSQPNLHALSLLSPQTPPPAMSAILSLLEYELHSPRQYSVPLVGCVPPSAVLLPDDALVSSLSRASLHLLTLRAQATDDSLLDEPTVLHSNGGLLSNGFAHLQPEPIAKHTRSVSLPVSSLGPSPPLSPQHDLPSTNHRPPIPANHRPPSPASLTSPPPNTKKRRSQTFAPGDSIVKSHPSASLSANSSPVRKPLVTPVRTGNRLRRRRSHEHSLFTEVSGPTTLLKKLFTRKRPIPKQFSLPDPVLSTQQSSLSDGVASPPRTPSPLPPPHAMMDDEFGGGSGARLRVESVSGRPVRSMGMALLLGEESSSESEGEDATFGGSGTGKPSTAPTTPQHNCNPDDSSGTGSRRNSSKKSKSASDLAALSLTGQEGEGEGEGEEGAVSRRQLRRHTTLPSELSMEASRSKSQTQPELATPIKKDKSLRRKKRGSYAEAIALGTAPKVTGIFREPPRGEMRYVFLDPQQPKFGFKLESYGRISERGKVLQTFVQSVAPGSPAFMGGLYPGDTIMEVNGEDVKYAPVEEVVGAITRVPRTSKEKIKLTVEFVEGVTRLDRMKKADELKYQLRAMQASLRATVAKETKLLPTSPSLPSPLNILLAQDLPSWAESAPPTRPRRGPYPFNRHLNTVVTMYTDDILKLACDAVVLPLSSCFRSLGEEQDNVLYQFIGAGGSELLDELCLAKQCRLGQNITTQGHRLPASHMYHCVFGDLEESLLSCCRQALEVASSKRHRTIAFWVDGFVSISVSPNTIVESVRLWLQEELNGQRFERIVFAASDNTSLVEKCMHVYFPTQVSTNADSVLSSESVGQSQEGQRESWTSGDVTSGSAVSGEEGRMSNGVSGRGDKAGSEWPEEEGGASESSEAASGTAGTKEQSPSHDTTPDPHGTAPDPEVAAPEAEEIVDPTSVTEPQSVAEERSEETQTVTLRSPTPGSETTVKEKRWSNPMAVQAIPYPGSPSPVTQPDEERIRSPLDDIISQLEEEGRAQAQDGRSIEETNKAVAGGAEQSADESVEDLDRIMMGLQVLSDGLEQASTRGHWSGPSDETDRPSLNSSATEDVQQTDSTVHILNPLRVESDV